MCVSLNNLHNYLVAPHKTVIFYQQRSKCLTSGSRTRMDRDFLSSIRTVMQDASNSCTRSEGRGSCGCMVLLISICVLSVCSCLTDMCVCVLIHCC